MPPGKVHELAFLWFGLPGPLLIEGFGRDKNPCLFCVWFSLRCTTKKTRKGRRGVGNFPTFIDVTVRVKIITGGLVILGS